VAGVETTVAETNMPVAVAATTVGETNAPVVEALQPRRQALDITEIEPVAINLDRPDPTTAKSVRPEPVEGHDLQPTSLLPEPTFITAEGTTGTPEAQNEPVETPSSAATNHRQKLRRAARIAWTIVSWTSVAGAAAAVTAILAVIVVPRAMGWKGMVVLSGSMEPTLHTGGMAFMQPLSSTQVEAIEPGDIITFRREGSDASISHRVVEVLGEDDSLAFVTKGDANNANDATAVEAKDVEGKVRWDVPYLGSLVDRLQTRSSYYAFIGIPAALLILSEAWNIASEVRRTRRDKHTILAEGASS
jgi:signal peptidase